MKSRNWNLNFAAAIEIVVCKNYVVRLRIQHTHAAVTRVHKPIAIGPKIVKTHENTYRWKYLDLEIRDT